MIFWGVVLVFVLIDKAMPSSVVRLALSPSLELNLKSLEVGPTLLSFNENHGFEHKVCSRAFEVV